MAKDSLAKMSSDFVALAPVDDQEDSLISIEEMRESVGNAPPSVSDLIKIKVPAGGATAWELIDENGEEIVAKTFEAVIAVAQDMKMYYASKFTGGNEPPDCMSLDLIHGYRGENCPEEVTGMCATCPMNEWGSAVDDEGNPTKGKACNDRKQMIVYRATDLEPCLLSIPPSSLATVQKYIRRLPAQRSVYWAVVTEFSLSKQKSAGGVPFSRVELKTVRPLNESEINAVRAIRSQYTAALQRHTAEE